MSPMQAGPRMEQNSEENNQSFAPELLNVFFDVSLMRRDADIDQDAFIMSEKASVKM